MCQPRFWKKKVLLWQFFPGNMLHEIHWCDFVSWMKQGQKMSALFLKAVPTTIHLRPQLETALGAPAYVYTWMGPCDIINFGHLI